MSEGVLSGVGLIKEFVGGSVEVLLVLFLLLLRFAHSLIVGNDSNSARNSAVVRYSRCLITWHLTSLED